MTGLQEPPLSACPEFVSTTGYEAIELAFMAGLELDEWQQWCLINALGERADGQWSSFGVGIVVPRQNGKGGLLEARELAGLFLLTERLIIHSAHQFDTSIEAFDRLVGLVENTPALSKRLAPRGKGITRSHGSEGIRLRTGRRVRFRTRTKGGGRGFTCDCLILDEAMILPDAFLSAVLPTLAARPNPQIWYTGSAVDQITHEHGLVLARVRDRGLKGEDPRLFYAEWSAADDLDDVDEEWAADPETWAVANPGLGIRISTEYVEAERREFGSNLRGFAVERLGVGDWPDVSSTTNRLIPAELWDACLDQKRYPVGRVCFAFDVAPDQSSAAIAVSGIRADGKIYVEVLDHRRGTGWLPGRVAELKRGQANYGVWLDAGGPAGSQLAELKAMRIEPEVVGAREHGQACGMFWSAIRDGRLRHRGTSSLTVAVGGADRRQVGDVWLWDRKGTEDISPLVACTLAAWGAQSTKPTKRSPVINLNDL